MMCRPDQTSSVSLHSVQVISCVASSMLRMYCSRSTCHRPLPPNLCISPVTHGRPSVAAAAEARPGGLGGWCSTSHELKSCPPSANRVQFWASSPTWDHRYQNWSACPRPMPGQTWTPPRLPRDFLGKVPSARREEVAASPKKPMAIGGPVGSSSGVAK